MHRNSLGDGYGGELVRELFSVSGGGGCKGDCFKLRKLLFVLSRQTWYIYGNVLFR